jgi:hypothetical protein
MKLTRKSSLPESDRAEMRKLRTERPWLWSYAALAEFFGTTRWTAMNICKQKGEA